MARGDLSNKERTIFGVLLPSERGKALPAHDKQVEAAAATGRVHVRADGQGRPLGFVLTSGEAPDHRAINALEHFPIK